MGLLRVGITIIHRTAVFVGSISLSSPVLCRHSATVRGLIANAPMTIILDSNISMDLPIGAAGLGVLGAPFTVNWFFTFPITVVLTWVNFCRFFGFLVWFTIVMFGVAQETGAGGVFKCSRATSYATSVVDRLGAMYAASGTDTIVTLCGLRSRQEEGVADFARFVRVMASPVLPKFRFQYCDFCVPRLRL